MTVKGLKVGSLNTSDDVSGLVKIVPTSVTVGSGSGSASALGTVTFSGVSSVSLNGVFNSTYKSYRMVTSIDSGSATANLRTRFRASGSDDSSSSYKVSGYYAFLEGAGSSFTTNTTTTYFDWGNYLNGAYPSFTTSDINNPYLAQHKTVLSQVVSNNGAYLGQNFLQLYAGTTVFDGITVYGSTGTFTGTISIYGYN